MFAIDLVEFLPEARQRHAEVFLHLFLGAQVGNKEVDAALHFGADAGGLNLDTIESRLVQEQLVQGHLLGDDTIGVTVDGHTLIERLLVLFLNVTFEYGLVTDDPRNLLGYIILCQRCESQRCKRQCVKKSQFHL